MSERHALMLPASSRERFRDEPVHRTNAGYRRATCPPMALHLRSIPELDDKKQDLPSEIPRGELTLPLHVDHPAAQDFAL